MGSPVPGGGPALRVLGEQTGDVDRSEVARLLRRARARVSPQDVGLAQHGPRRVSGLRREEVATLAGVSVDYIVRLEQGRGPHPSAAVLGALVRALRLSDSERDELFDVAGVRRPGAGRIDMVVRASVRRLLDRLVDVPAMVLSAKGDVLAWNAMAAALIGDWSRFPPQERNIVWQRFPTERLGTERRVAPTSDEEAETDAQAVASLRTAAIAHPDDPGVRALVEQLRSRSPRFAALWEEAPATTWLSHTKTFDHPEIGTVTLDCEALTVPDSGQTVIVYSAEAGSDADRRLDLLRVVGTRSLSPPAPDGRHQPWSTTG